jgi:hypothetical protein
MSDLRAANMYSSYIVLGDRVGGYCTHSNLYYVYGLHSLLLQRLERARLYEHDKALELSELENQRQEVLYCIFIALIYF